MDNEFSEKVHVGIRRERQKNGDIYVFENKTVYDPKSRKTKSVGQKLTGKIKAGTHEIVSTRSKRKKSETSSTASASRLRTGLTDILNWAGKASGIDADVFAAFSEGEAAKILSIARYWLATDGNTLPRLESWQIMHELPYPQGISEDVYGELFQSVGLNEASVQQYFHERAASLMTHPVLALDSTTISSYSENQIEARQGFNKDRDGLDTIKLLTLYSVKDREPIAFAKQPGNIPDVISIENAIAQIRCFNIEKPLIVTDNGYYSEKNIMEFARRNLKFLTLADPEITWIRAAVDSLRGQFDGMSAVCPFDLSICGASMMRMHEFKRTRQRSRNGVASGETECFSKRLYLHVFYSQDYASKHALAFRKELLLLKQMVEAGQTEFTQAAERRIAKYLVCSTLGRGGKLNVTFNDKACAEAKRYFGFFTLISNQPMDTFEALTDYRLREKIEELFCDQKNSFDGHRTRVWTPDRLRGRLFVQFVGLGLHCFIAKKIEEVKKKLGHDENGKSAEQIKLEKKLLAWLENHSMAQIFDWFDCIETTAVKNDSAELRWSTESVARDRLFLNVLGVTKE